MQSVTDLYGQEYQRDSVSPRAVLAYARIAHVLVRMFSPETSIDIGSGGGALVRGLRALQVNAVGVEGSQHAVELLPDFVRLADLRLPQELGKYDLVTCFDVAEHIEPEFVGQFAENVKGCMKDHSILVFGAAPEGQDGLGHVNCQHPCYWMQQFYPLQVKPGMSEVIRTLVKMEPETDFVWWVSKNLMCFGA